MRDTNYKLEISIDEKNRVLINSSKQPSNFHQHLIAGEILSMTLGVSRLKALKIVKNNYPKEK